MISIVVIFWLCSVLTGVVARLCPDLCVCSDLAVKCSGLGVRELDSSVPLKIRFFDLSNNPSLAIKKHTFTRYKHLETLNLKNCSIKDSIKLPDSITNINLSHNKLQTDSLKRLLQNGNWTFLRELDASSNNLNLNNEVFGLIPRGLRALKLGNNVLPKVTRSYLAGLKSLRLLNISGCGLQEIESGAFDSLRSLSMLALHNNKLRNLPLRLFKFTINIHSIFLNNNLLLTPPDLSGIRYLMVLDLTANRITRVKSSDFAIYIISALRLSANRIKTFNFTGIRFFSLDLSRNEITAIPDHVFSGNTTIKYLFLHSNKIGNMSPKAFDKPARIVELFLHRNYLTKLQRSQFKGHVIDKLFLFDNKLTHIEGFLDGMKGPPYLLLLFGNPTLHIFRGSDYRSLHNKSVIYIGCRHLKKIIEKVEIKADLVCTPTKETKITLQTDILHGHGFRCYTDSFRILYHCQPCFIGYRENCIAGYCGGTCVACPAGGFYQDEMAAISCKSCPLGQYVPPQKAPGKNALDCLTCPKGTNTNSSADYRACSCLDGYARTNRFGECNKCLENGFNCKRDYQKLKRGYLMSWETMETASNKSCKELFLSFMANLDTKSDSYNRRTVHYECNMPTPHKCPIKGSCIGGVNATCKLGYKGVLCAVCEKGFMKNFGKCIKCPSAVVAVIQFLAYIVVFVLLCWLVSLTDRIRMSNSNETREDSEAITRDDRTFADAILSSFKILIGFYQVLSGTIHALGYIHWPETMKTTMSLLQYIQVEIIRVPSLHCIRADWEIDAKTEFWFAIIATVAVPFFIFLYFSIKSLKTTRCYSASTQEIQQKQSDSAKRCFRAAVLFIFATYPLVSSHIFRLLPVSCHTFCTTEAKGRCMNQVSYLRSDYRVTCLQNSNKTNGTLMAAYTASILPIGLPFVLLILLWRCARKSKQLDEEITFPINDIIETSFEDEPYVNARLLNENNTKNEGIVKFALKFAYENYRDDCWYWEVSEMFRKLIMGVGILFFLRHTKVGLGGMIVIATFFAVLHAAKSPIKDRFENFLQMLSLSIIPINLAIAAILQSKSSEDEAVLAEKDDSWALGIMLVILNSLVFALVALRLLRAIRRKLSSAKTAGQPLSCCKRFLLCCCGCVKFTPINSGVDVIARGGKL